MAKKTIGIVEKVKIIGKSEKEVLALMDTGAKLTSVDTKLAAETGIGPVKRTAKIKVASKNIVMTRPVLYAGVEIFGKRFDTEVNLQDRSHMLFPVLVGRNVLSGNFIVDSEKRSEIFKEMAKKKKMMLEYE